MVAASERRRAVGPQILTSERPEIAENKSQEVCKSSHRQTTTNNLVKPSRGTRATSRLRAGALVPSSRLRQEVLAVEAPSSKKQEDNELPSGGNQLEHW